MQYVRRSSPFRLRLYYGTSLRKLQCEVHYTEEQACAFRLAAPRRPVYEDGTKSKFTRTKTMRTRPGLSLDYVIVCIRNCGFSPASQLLI